MPAWAISLKCFFPRGTCLSAGCVKALVRVLGETLFEKTVDQAIMLLAQAPNRGRDMVIVSGTGLPARVSELVLLRPASRNPFPIPAVVWRLPLRARRQRVYTIQCTTHCRPDEAMGRGSLGQWPLHVFSRRPCL